MLRSFRNANALVFMFGVPLMITGMFYLMFGKIASQGELSLPVTRVVIANQDRGGPRFQVSTRHIPGGGRADTMGELVVAILSSEDMADLIAITLVADAAAARAAVDSQQAQVAVIIPPDFSLQFADVDGQAALQFYQDPTLTIGPAIVQSLLNQFMDGMAGVKIAVNVALDQVGSDQGAVVGELVRRYLDESLVQDADPEAALLQVRPPSVAQVSAAARQQNVLLAIVAPIMGGMLIFYAFYTGVTTAQSILREEEEHTLSRLFTTPTSRVAILGGKFLSVFLTVAVQVSVLLAVAHLIFGIHWGAALPVALAAMGIVCCAASTGIFANSLLKTSRQGGALMGGALAITGMLGMIGTFGINSPSAQRLADTVSLLVPQGWAVRALLQAMHARPLVDVLSSMAILLAWSAAFFLIGVWRFNRRYV
jgi:ABC-2 type transport system permease protein